MRNIQKSALMAEGKPRSPKSPTKELSNSDTFKEEQVNPIHETSEEERHYRTIQVFLLRSNPQGKQEIVQGKWSSS